MAAVAAPGRELRRLAWLQPAVLVGSLVPHVVIVVKGLTGRLGANPIATALNQLGLLALIFLVASLACTPAKIVFGWKWPLKVRKTLGLLGFYTALAHFLVYFVVDQGLNVGTVIEDVLLRPFILVGFLALLLLVPLARTSTKEALQRLGAKNWRRLHRLAYVCAALGCLHYILRVKQDLLEPLLYTGVLALLLAVRAFDGLRKHRGRG